MSKQPDYTIIVDSREQTPWSWGEDVPTIRAALPAGDYSIVGMEDRVSIERKTLNDFVQTVIKQRKRFAEELKKLEQLRHVLIVVEADIRKILIRNYTCKAHPMSVLGAAFAIQSYSRIPVCFWEDRQEAIAKSKLWLDWVWKHEKTKAHRNSTPGGEAS